MPPQGSEPAGKKPGFLSRLFGGTGLAFKERQIARDVRAEYVDQRREVEKEFSRMKKKITEDLEKGKEKVLYGREGFQLGKYEAEQRRLQRRGAYAEAKAMGRQIEELKKQAERWFYRKQERPTWERYTQMTRQQETDLRRFKQKNTRQQVAALRREAAGGTNSIRNQRALRSSPKRKGLLGSLFLR